MNDIGNQQLDELGISLTINELLQVQLQEDSISSVYRSRIENIVDQKLLATWPTLAGIRMPVHADQMLSFSLVREGIAYSFNGLVDSTATEPLPQITVIINSEIHRIQRRQNFRIRSLLPIELSGEIRGTSSNETSHPFFLKTTTYNISAGGIAIRIQKGIPEGTLLEAKIGLQDKEPIIKVPCHVVYSEPSFDNPKLQQNGIQFLAITEKEKARIVRYVYRTQLKGVRD
jgi:c-di-GMP-binding flagellar brake protein YcgR